MTLIQVKTHKVYDLLTLFRVALKKVYEFDKLTTMELDLMMSSINDWTNHLEMKKKIGFSAIDEENQIQLEYIGKILSEDERGMYDRRKRLFIQKGIDYRKFHRLPESYKPEDFVRAKYYHSLLPKEEQ